ncbi:MAG: hypothetical protein ABSG32_25140 [Terriglobia bacterium]|jgi:hypothetical protein
MNEDDWKLLLGRIKDRKCTPFLGAGVNYDILPLGGQIAQEWATNEGLPLRSSTVQIYVMDIHGLMALARQRVTALPSEEGCKKYLDVEKCPPVPENVFVVDHACSIG